MGWIGSQRELWDYFDRIGADKDEQGRYVVRGGLAPFLGIERPDNDIVVNEHAEVRVKGEWRPIQPTSGMNVMVIM